MIKGKIQFKKKKLTLEQKALKKVVTPVAREVKAEVRGSVPKLTGALKFAVDYKVISRKGNAAAVVGVKSKYARVVKGKEKIPNQYAIKVGAKDVLLSHINQGTVDKLRNAMQEQIQQMLEKAK